MGNRAWEPLGKRKVRPSGCEASKGDYPHGIWVGKGQQGKNCSATASATPLVASNPGLSSILPILLPGDLLALSPSSPVSMSPFYLRHRNTVLTSVPFPFTSNLHMVELKPDLWLLHLTLFGDFPSPIAGISQVRSSYHWSFQVVCDSQAFQGIKIK